MGGEREVAEVRVVEGAREEARRLGLRQPQPQPLHGHLGEAGEALRLRIAVGHEVRGGARVLQADLEHDVLALQLLGARHQPQLDAEAREQPHRHLLVAVAHAEGVRARVARAVLDVRL